MNETTIHARLRSYRAVEDRAASERFLAAHVAACDRHKLYGLTSVNPEWFHNPQVWFAMIESLDDGELLAGMRIQVADERHPLPTTKAYEGVELLDFVRRSQDSGLCELCGAWTSPRGAHTGAFKLVAMATVAMTAPLGGSKILVSCSVHTLPIVTEYGILVETSFADQGRFYYPTPDNLSFLAVNPDAWSMETATPFARDAVHELRARPHQTMVQHTGRYTIEADLDLEIVAAPQEEPELVYAGAG
jgi:hypothetical protein